MAIDWERTTERNLVYLLYHADDAAITQQAYETLKGRLRRFFRFKKNQRNWYLLEQLEDDLIDEMIARLTKRQMTLIGNSLQFKVYVCNLLLDVCTKTLRRSRDEVSLEIPTYEDAMEEAKDRICAPGDGPFAVSHDWAATTSHLHIQPLSRLLSKQEFFAIARRAFESLPEREQELFDRSARLGQSLDEIAEELGMSYSAARVAISRARDRLVRAIIDLLAERNGRYTPEQVSAAIQHLPEEARLLFTYWWGGETSWRKLGKQFSPPKSATEAKALFLNNLPTLFHILQTV